MVHRIRYLLAAQVTCRIHFTILAPFLETAAKTLSHCRSHRAKTEAWDVHGPTWRRIFWRGGLKVASDQRLRADRHGHPKGDEVLASVGATLQATLRESDFVGRYGGEEFIMILPATGREAAVQVAERVREAIANIEVLDEESVTASFGVAVFPDDASDATH